VRVIQAVALHPLQHAGQARTQDAAAPRDLSRLERVRRFAVEHADDPPLLFGQREFLENRAEHAHQRLACLEQQHGQVAMV
jgi:hypothetical protein